MENLKIAQSSADVQQKRDVPLLIHVFNVAALVVLGLIFLAAVVARTWHLIFLSPVLILLVIYKPLHRSRAIVFYYFALSVLTLFWILFCENIVTVDNALGTRITASLPLGPRLQSYADAKLTARRALFYQRCCGDPLSYNLKPGSKHTETYDCPTCNDPYQLIADETGYLNNNLGLMKGNDQVDLFFAGDSVLQGVGMPSVVEAIKRTVSARTWNLSLNGYGPRQKINALITYALPKHPKWLVVEFFSKNDVSDANENEVCESQPDFRCRFNMPELRRRFAAHPVYRTMVNVDSNGVDVFDFYAENDFTIAVSRYLIHSLKNTLKHALVAESKKGDLPSVYGPIRTDHELRDGKLLSWVKTGMAVTHRDYEHLVTKLAELENKPRVILLYNPSGYEIYRDILRARDPESDEIAEFQLEAQRAFADNNGWIFLDLTQPLRNKLKESKTWIYGRYDQMHWSQKGTAIVAPVLATELLKAMAK
jgi:hypothetical protein